MSRALSAMLLVVTMGCNTEPDSGPGPFEGRIQLAPDVIFLEPGETKAVLTRFYATTEGDLAHADFAVAGSPGIAVRFDSTFRQVYNADGVLGPFPQAAEQRLLVTMSADIASGTVRVSTKEVSEDLVVIRRP